MSSLHILIVFNFRGLLSSFHSNVYRIGGILALYTTLVLFIYRIQVNDVFWDKIWVLTSY